MTEMTMPVRSLGPVLGLALLLAAPAAASAAVPGPAAANADTRPPLPASVEALLGEGAPGVDAGKLRDTLRGMPEHVVDVLAEKIDERWIGSLGQLRTLVGTGLDAQGLELALKTNCILCHTDPDEQEEDTLFTLDPAEPGVRSHLDFGEYVADVHFRAGLSCTGCHGGDPEDEEHGEGMFAGWPKSRRVRAEDRTWIPQFCGGCHADSSFMRRFNPAIATDQLAKYGTSRHGQRLLGEGDSRAAQCLSCHGVHGIRSPDSRLSSVHPQRIPETCGACHADPRHMAGFLTDDGEPLPTDQLAQYRESVHGQALLVKGDLGAPACNDCHGNHAALPPEVQSVAQVCRNCHLAQGQLFDGSRHKKVFRANDWPECGQCHGNHGIAYPQDGWIGDTPGTICHDCHAEEADDNEQCDRTAAHFRDTIARLVAADERLAEDIHHVAERGLDAEALQAVHADLTDGLLQTRTYVHSFEITTFDQAAAPALAATAKAGELLAAAESEYRFRRRGLMVAIGLMMLLALSIWLKLRDHERSVAADEPATES
jgi:hypothetical protein